MRAIASHFEIARCVAAPDLAGAYESFDYVEVASDPDADILVRLHHRLHRTLGIIGVDRTLTVLGRGGPPESVRLSWEGDLVHALA